MCEQEIPFESFLKVGKSLIQNENNKQIKGIEMLLYLLDLSDNIINNNYTKQLGILSKNGLA
jgi:hypothetical protein